MSVKVVSRSRPPPPAAALLTVSGSAKTSMFSPDDSRLGPGVSDGGCCWLRKRRDTRLDAAFMARMGLSRVLLTWPSRGGWSSRDTADARDDAGDSDDCVLGLGDVKGLGMEMRGSPLLARPDGRRGAGWSSEDVRADAVLRMKSVRKELDCMMGSEMIGMEPGPRPWPVFSVLAAWRRLLRRMYRKMMTAMSSRTKHPPTTPPMMDVVTGPWEPELLAGAADADEDADVDVDLAVDVLDCVLAAAEDLVEVPVAVVVVVEVELAAWAGCCGVLDWSSFRRQSDSSWHEYPNGQQVWDPQAGSLTSNTLVLTDPLRELCGFWSCTLQVMGWMKLQFWPDGQHMAVVLPARAWHA